MSKRAVVALVLGAAAFGLLFVYFVYPTPWYYYFVETSFEDATDVSRRHRITGEWQTRTAGGRWEPLRKR